MKRFYHGKTNCEHSMHPPAKLSIFLTGPQILEEGCNFVTKLKSGIFNDKKSYKQGCFALL